jgi:hypothetical protein
MHRHQLAYSRVIRHAHERIDTVAMVGVENVVHVSASITAVVSHPRLSRPFVLIDDALSISPAIFRIAYDAVHVSASITAVVVAVKEIDVNVHG